MDGLLSRAGLMTSPRSLLALTLMLSVLSAGGGRGTLAYFTSTKVSENMSFTSGLIDINGSTVPVSAGISWNTSGGGTACRTFALDTSANDTTSQAMVPGQFCVAPITIQNTSSANAVDSWMRIRLVRDTTDNTTATEALNNRLKFYMSEYHTPTGGTLAGLQSNDCTPANFAPAGNGVTDSSTAVGKSNAAIATGAISVGGNNGTRTALSTLGDVGKNIGEHPAIFAPGDTTATTYFQTGNPYAAPGDTTSVPVSVNKGLGLVKGSGSSTNESGVRTDFDNTVRNAFNLVGNDEVNNPRRISNSERVGNRGFSSNDEAQLNAGTVRYYCAAIFFPSDVSVAASNGDITPAGTVTSVTDLNTKGDNAAQTGSLTYRLIVTAAQKAGRSVN